MHRLLFLTVLSALTACASASPRPTTAARPAADLRISDAALHQLLDTVPLDTARTAALARYEQQHAAQFEQRLALVAEDSAASVEARYNAVGLLGERLGARALPSLQDAFTDPDPRVRAAVVVATARIHQASGGTRGRNLLVRALDDRVTDVQARALDALGMGDPDLLRSFLARHRDREAASIAAALLRVAEERGVPLAADSSGVLRRALPDGPRLSFTPVARWPQWQAATGTVRIESGSAAPLQIDSVEVVRNVVPAFFSPDARYLVYERRRTIFVRDLTTGGVTEVGPGIAPRPRPFTGDFTYLREDPALRTDMNDRTRLRYEVLSVPFATPSTQPVVLGAVGVIARMTDSGYYSAARWHRVLERDGAFSLEAEGMETFRLPNPFGSRPLP